MENFVYFDYRIHRRNLFKIYYFNYQQGSIIKAKLRYIIISSFSQKIIIANSKDNISIYKWLCKNSSL